MYDKGRILYGLSEARRHTVRHRSGGKGLTQSCPLYIVEGYTDVLTLHDKGIRNVVGVTSAQVSKEHTSALISYNIRDVILCLDGDAEGERGTTRSIAVLQENRSLHIQVVRPLGDAKDPDELVRTLGIEAFTSLPKQSAFRWQLDCESRGSSNRGQIAIEIVPSIVAEPSPILRQGMVTELAEWAGLEPRVIEAQIRLEEQTEEARISREVQQRAQSMVRELETKGGIEDSIIVASRFLQDARRIQGQGANARVIESFGNRIESVRRRCREGNSAIDWNLGHNMRYLERAIRGVPKLKEIVTIVGPPNVGKSNLMRAIALNLVFHNHDDSANGIEAPSVLYMSTDDSLDTVIAHMVASIANLPANLINAERWTNERYPDLRNRIDDAWATFDSLTPANGGRLLVTDVEYGTSMSSAELQIRELQHSTGRQHTVILIDNLYNSMNPNKDDYQELARLCSELRAILADTSSSAIVTGELRKSADYITKLADLKGNSQFSYDVTVALAILNDSAIHPDTSDMVFPFSNETPDAMSDVNVLFPIVQVQIVKNKRTYKKGRVCNMRMYPDRSRCIELGAQDARRWETWKNSHEDRKQRGELSWPSEQQDYNDLVNSERREFIEAGP